MQPATWRNGGEGEMLPNKSRDEKQRSEAAPKKKKKGNEEESESFELLQCILPGLDWVMLAHTYVHTGVEPMPQKKPSVGLCPI